MPITELKTGHWYRWTGDKERPASFGSYGVMDFILDGLPHKCTYGGGGCGAFEDSPLPDQEWSWYSVLDFLEDVTGKFILENRVKMAIAEAERHITTEGKKFDAGKTRWDLVDLSIVEEVAKVATFGIKKGYAEHSWKKVPNAPERYYAALMRHLNEYRAGKLIDPESGLSHLAHAAWNVFALIHFERESVDKMVSPDHLYKFFDGKVGVS